MHSAYVTYIVIFHIYIYVYMYTYIYIHAHTWVLFSLESKG